MLEWRNIASVSHVPVPLVHSQNGFHQTMDHKHHGNKMKGFLKLIAISTLKIIFSEHVCNIIY